MKYFLLSCVLLLTALGLSAQTNVEIAGEVVGGAGKRVLLGGYSDMLTQSEVVLDTVTVAPDGKFTLHCYANYPRLVFLQMERYSQSFYIEPGRTYNVYVPDFEWDIDEKKNIFLEPVALPVEFIGVDSTELNLKIMRFEAVVDSFMAANREKLDFRFKPDRRIFNLLHAMVNLRFRQPSQLGSFFDRYVEYTMLGMRLDMKFDSRKRLVKEHIVNEPIRYHDETYMRFFLALFDHAISGGTKQVAQWKMADWVGRGDLDSWLDSLGLDPLLQNEQVRELAALEALKEMFYTKGFDREGVKRTTALLAERTKFEDHKVLAQRLLESFGSPSASGNGSVRGEWHAGSVVSGFELPDVERKKVRLDDFKGKWVYASFVRVGDPHSQKEIETMAHFRDSVYKAHPEVVFLTVVCDREFQKMYHFLKNSKRGGRYQWTWLHFDGDYDLLERWGVTSYPTFVLIDPQGRRVYDYTPWPGTGILTRLWGGTNN